jgi:hypothetical protein
VSYRTSPFRGVADLYNLERMSIADSLIASPLLVWRVDKRIANGALLGPVQRQIRGG